MIGGIDSLEAALAETPLEPLTAVTGGLNEVLTTVSDGIAGVTEQDPTGLANLLAQTVGQEQPGLNDLGGLVGTVSNLSEGLALGTEDTPLDPLVDPLTQTLGFSPAEQIDGVASGLGSVGETLLADESPLAPLTSDLLAPIVGTDLETGGDSGLGGTLDQAGEGLTDLTNPDSALAPLEPLTSALQDPVVSTLSDGISQLGSALVDNADMAGPGAELLTTVGSLLGGTTETGGTTPPPTAGTTGTPLDAVLDPLAGAVMGGGTGTGTTGTPLDAVLDPLAGAVMGGAESPIPTDPAALTDLLTGSTSPIGSLPGADQLTDQLGGLTG